jgi:hypothetical protein
MKKITLLFALLITSIGFSQTYDLLTNGDFENGKGAWGGSDFTVVAGEAFFAATNAAGNPWDTQLTFGGMTFEKDKEYVLTFKARSTEDRKITVAIQNAGAWDDQFRQDFDITATMTEYTATFNAAADNTNVQIGFLMANFGTTAGVYYDDITLMTAGTTPETCNDGILNNGETEIDCGGPNCSACPTDPTTAPAAPPTRNAWDVISIYGDAYGTAVGLNAVDWDGGSDAVESSYAGNNVLKISNGSNDFIGFGVANANGYVDATDMTHVHADFWIDGDYVAGQVLKVKLSNHANLDGETSSIIPEAFPADGDNQNWFSFDLPIDGAKDRIRELLLIYTNSATAPSTVYVDNIYMYRAATASVDNNDLLGFSMYPNPASNRLNISAKETIQNADIFNVLGKKVMSLDINKSSESIDVSNLNSGIYLIKYNVNGTTGTAKFIKQ